MFNIAINTFREIVRNKFLYLILFFAILFILFSITLGKLTIGDDNKIIIDFGLVMIELFGLVGVLFVGSQMLFKEIEGKTIFLILSKPIKRYEFILGKFLGFSLIILLITLIQSLIYLAVLFFKDIFTTIPLNDTILIINSLIFTFLKLEILLVLVLFFSTFMSNILTILVSVLIYFIAHSFSIILDLIFKMKNEISIIAIKIFQLIFPPMEAMNIKNYIGTVQTFSTSYFLLNILYAIIYTAIILFFTVKIFDRKKFES